MAEHHGGSNVLSHELRHLDLMIEHHGKLEATRNIVGLCPCYIFSVKPSYMIIIPKRRKNKRKTGFVRVNRNLPVGVKSGMLLLIPTFVTEVNYKSYLGVII